MKATIYQILNISNNKCYIGSSVDYRRRKTSHLYYLKLNKHHSTKLQRAWNKYGEDSFRFVVLERFEYEDKHEILNKEQEYLDNLKPYYNVALLANSCLGAKKAKERIINLSSGEKFTSVKQAALSIGDTETMLRKKLNGLMANNTTLVLLDEQARKKSEDRYKNTQRQKYVVVQIINNEGLHEFPSINKAAEFLEWSGKTVKAHCENKKKFKKKKDFIIKYKF